MESGAATRGQRTPFNQWLDDWSFARVELNLSDDEFNNLSTPQWNALLRAWEDGRARNYAVQNATTLNARWGTAKNMFPFKPSMFLPETPQAAAQRERNEELIRIAKQRALHMFMQQWSNELRHSSTPK